MLHFKREIKPLPDLASFSCRIKTHVFGILKKSHFKGLPVFGFLPIFLLLF